MDTKKEKVEGKRQMKNKKKCGISFLLLCILLIFVCSTSVVAADQEFSIHVEFNIPNEEKASDTQIFLYQVATAQIDKMGNLHMKPIKLYEDLVFDHYTEENAPKLLEQICARLQQPGTVPEEELTLAPVSVKKPDVDGNIKFQHLEAGVYLLMKWKDMQPKNLKMLPMLVYLPHYDQSSDHWETVATVIPKFDWEEVPKPDPKPNQKPPTITDTKLPQTGMVQWPVPVLVIVGLLLIAFGYGFNRREK